VRVLYVSHTAEISGGERSLLGLLAGLPATVHTRVATPRGDLQRAVDQLGIATTPIAGTAGSLRVHPLHTPRAAAEMLMSAGKVRKVAGAHRAEVAHANSIRAGVILSLARAPRVAKIVHVRDCLPPGPLASATMRLIAASAQVIVANSHYTARSVQALAPSARVAVVYNAIDLARWDPTRVEAARTGSPREEKGRRRLVLGVVAQLSPWKGQDTAIEALARVRKMGVDAHLLIVGEAKFVDPATRFDNRAYVARMHELVERLGLAEHVSWLGERGDVPELMAAMDVLLLPSWEEPFGRSVIEAMAMGVPVVATNIGGPAEIIEAGTDGCLVAPREPQRWAEAIRELADQPGLRAQMGRAGRSKAEQRFSLQAHVKAIVELYERAIAASTAPPPRAGQSVLRARAES
jgi:glycosyltransferase involved in cell wall biosynthesis